MSLAVGIHPSFPTNDLLASGGRLPWRREVVPLRGLDNFSRLAGPGYRTPHPIRDIVRLRSVFGPSLTLESGGEGWHPETFLDNAATTRPIVTAEMAGRAIDDFWANPHTMAHLAAELVTEAVEEARAEVLRFVGADPSHHVAVAVGAGATAAINRVARTLRRRRHGVETVVLTTAMEHHANLLPWGRKWGNDAEMAEVDPERGTLRLDDVETRLRDNGGRVRLLTVTAASNVTGIINDIHLLAEMAHRYGAQILVDAAQALVHIPLSMSPTNALGTNGIDWLVASAHKAHSKGPGILVGPRESFPSEPVETGGGIVRAVSSPSDYNLTSNVTAREEAGTQDGRGWVMLGASLLTHRGIGMERVRGHEVTLLARLIGGLLATPGVQVYGDTDIERTPRTGVVSFNCDGIPHPVVARALSAEFGIAVRNACFCAHPYVKRLARMDEDAEREFVRMALSDDRSRLFGMVRASLGLLNDAGDVDRLLRAVGDLIGRRDQVVEDYEIDPKGRAWLKGEERSPARLHGVGPLFPVLLPSGEMVFHDRAKGS